MEILDLLLSVYLVVVNLTAYACFGLDKAKAKKKKWRIPESTLLILSFAGGALGAWLGMRTFRHKTRHWKFKVLVPVSMILWIIILGYLYGYGLSDLVAYKK